MFKLITAFLLSIFVVPTLVWSQDYTWWNNKHNWDGHTDWRDYILTTPAYLGPNALPVPEILQGKTKQKAEFTLGADAHFSTGDNTQNLKTSVYIPLYTPKVGLQVGIVPLEHYAMDTLTRDERGARNESGEGIAVGDFYVSTFIQVVENHPKLPDVMISINLKTASGSKLSDARYSDTPGYYFDLSVGKNYQLQNFRELTVRPYAMAGFLCWQMQGSFQPQDDALTYGAGFSIKHPRFYVNNTLGGYFGYLNQGDRPIVYRFKIQTQSSKRFTWGLSYQKGLHDFAYQTFSFNCTAKLDGLLN